MTKEQELFLKIIGNHLCQNKTVQIDDVDWKELYNIAMSQQMTAIVFKQCKKFIPGEYYSDFHSLTVNTLVLSKTKKELAIDTVKILNDAGVKSFLIKGQVLDKYYPVSELRTMGDIDIVVEDIEKANKVLLSNGFLCVDKNKGYDWSYTKNGVYFEIHSKLVYKQDADLDIQYEYFLNMWDYYFNGQLDDNFHFIFVLFHLYKHFVHTGVGFRQFTDIAVLVKNNSTLNFEYIEKELKKIGLWDFAMTAFSFIEKWFCVSSPVKCCDIDDKLYEESTKYIFSNGVLGFDNKENSEVVDLQMKILKSGKGYLFAKITHILHSMFPSYDEMVKLYYCDFLKGKKILLPVAWIYRFFFRIKSKQRRSKFIEKTFVSKSKIEHKVNMMKQWGADTYKLLNSNTK